MVETSRVEVDADAGFVRFKPLMKTDEHARYNCTATNDVGSDSAVGKLRVLGRWAPVNQFSLSYTFRDRLISLV